MFPSFLPAAVADLREPVSISLAQSIKRQRVVIPVSKALPAARSGAIPISTAYTDRGTGGTPTLLLHGFDSSVLEFRRLLPLLAAQTETWAVDLVGFGFTERVSGLPFGPSLIKTHLYCFWKTLIDRPVILVGASMGGAAAIDFTLTYPQAVEKLVLINSVGYSGSFPVGRLLFFPLDFLAVEWWHQRKIQPLFLGSRLGDWDPALMDRLRCATLHLEMPGWHEAISTFTKSGGYDLSEKITQVDKPTLILWGEADGVLGAGDAAKFRRDIVDSRLIWIRSGHAPQLEQPHAIAHHILAF